jgi:hypothetical protein
VIDLADLAAFGIEYIGAFHIFAGDKPMIGVYRAGCHGCCSFSFLVPSTHDASRTLAGLKLTSCAA